MLNLWSDAAGQITAQVAASTKANTTAKTAARKLSDKNYKLGPQDVIAVRVDDYPAYSHENVPVLPDGSINLAFYGQVKAAGKTVLQLQKELRQILGRRFRRPELLTVSIISVRPPKVEKPLSVFVMGAVAKPGSIVIERNHRIAKVVAEAGGIQGRLDEVQASLIRRGVSPQRIDLFRAIQQPTSDANLILQDGDTLNIIAPEPGRVVVNGDVARPGVFEMHRTPRFGTELSLYPRLLDVLIAAGGVRGSLSPDGENTTDRAQEAEGGTLNNQPDNQIQTTNQISANDLAGGEPAQFTGYILRAGQKIPLQLNEVLEAKDRNDPANVPILPGDFLTVEYVPFKPPKPPVMLTIFVEGSAARQPGAYTVPEGTRLLEVIARAGGLSQSLTDTRVSLRRGGNRIVPINLEQAFSQDDAQANPPLLNGDIVMVREPDTIEVKVTGQFAKPNALQLPVGTTLNDAIAAAGGLNAPPSQTRLSVVRRKSDGGQMVLEIDPVALLEKRDLAQNARLQAGDWINATELPAERKPNVLLSGAVLKPGPYEIVAGETLPQLLARAGGVANDALLSDVVVQREGKMLNADVYDAVKQGKPLDFPLQDNDFVVVKQNPNRVMVLEAVAKPGPVLMPEKRPMTLLDALNEAGGPQANANKKAIILLRKFPEGTPLQAGATRLPTEANLVAGSLQNVQAFTIAMDRNAAVAANTPLQPGDVIYVPTLTPKGPSPLRQLLPFITLFRLF